MRVGERLAGDSPTDFRGSHGSEGGIFSSIHLRSTIQKEDIVRFTIDIDIIKANLSNAAHEKHIASQIEALNS